MKSFGVLATTSVAAVFLTLVLPAVGTAQPPPDDSDGTGLLNRLFDRWVDSRRAARGLPPSTYQYRGDPEEGDGPLNRLFDQWVDNRRAARGIAPSTWSYPYTGYGYRYSGPLYQPYRYGPPSYTMPVLPAVYQMPAYGSDPVPSGATSGPAAATLRVIVPAGAAVWFDGTANTQSSPTRSYTTPVLNGPTAVAIKAQWAGMTVTFSTVMGPGETSTVDLSVLK